MVVSVLMIGLGLVSLVCLIMVLIKIFHESVGLGILGIFCGLFTFIYGWVKVSEYGIQKVMLIWTLVFVAQIALQIVMVALTAAAGAG